MKKPLEDKDIPAVGFEFKVPPATELVGTYDSYTPGSGHGDARNRADRPARRRNRSGKEGRPGAPQAGCRTPYRGLMRHAVHMTDAGNATDSF